MRTFSFVFAIENWSTDIVFNCIEASSGLENTFSVNDKVTVCLATLPPTTRTRTADMWAMFDDVQIGDTQRRRSLWMSIPSSCGRWRQIVFECLGKKILLKQGRFCSKKYISKDAVTCSPPEFVARSLQKWCTCIGRWCRQKNTCSWSVKLLSEHYQTLLTCLPDLVTTGTTPLSNIVTLCKCCQ